MTDYDDSLDDLCEAIENFDGDLHGEWVADRIREIINSLIVLAYISGGSPASIAQAVIVDGLMDADKLIGNVNRIGGKGTAMTWRNYRVGIAQRLAERAGSEG